jgi:glycosyltransferase involved in cell wall biosynthesis
VNKKKLFIVRPTMGYGGADRVTLILLQALDPSQYDIFLVLMKAKGEFIQDIPPYVEVLPCRVSRLWFMLFPLWRMVRKYRPDIIFSTASGTNVPVLLARIASRLRHTRVIISERNVLVPPGNVGIARGFLTIGKRLFYRFANSITAVSEGVKEDLVSKLGLPPERITVLYNPVVDASLHAGRQLPVDHPWFDKNRKEPVILHVGRFVKQKDHRTLLEAFAGIKQHVQCKLFLLGDGPLMREMISVAQALGLSEDVCFYGFDKNPFRFMANCDVFVLSSLHEGMPGVLIQAMACGAPAVSTNCPFGPDEVITEPGENGILVPVSDPQRLADAVLELLRAPDRRRLLSIRGIEAVKPFEFSTAIASYLAVIDRETH